MTSMTQSRVNRLVSAETPQSLELVSTAAADSQLSLPFDQLLRRI